jgi:hypothetical protein
MEKSVYFKIIYCTKDCAGICRLPITKMRNVGRFMLFDNV